MLGLFKRKNPEEILNEIRKLAQDGNKEKALKRLKNLSGDVINSCPDEVEKLKGEIHQLVFEDYLQKAENMVQRNLFEDAVEWLSMALDYCPAQERDTILQRIESLEQGASSVSEPETFSEGEDAFEIETNFEDHVETLLATLDQRLVDVYRNQSQRFYEGYLALNHSQIDRALEIFEELFEESPHSVVDFERARCQMLRQDYEGALTLLKKAEPFFGVEPCDLARTYSVPSLLMECLHHTDRVQEMPESYIGLADPANQDPYLTLQVGVALEKLGRTQEAVDLFLKGTRSSTLADYTFHLARILSSQGEWQSSITILEKFLKPSCTSGACGPQALHLPSLHLLVSIYLQNKIGLDRARELLVLGDRNLRGYPLADHFDIWADYLDLTEDEENAKEMREKAQQARQQKQAPSMMVPQVKVMDDAIM